MDIHVEQLNILLNAIKTVVQNKNCPTWINKKLVESVSLAKSLKANGSINNEPTIEIDNTLKPFEINEEVVSNVKDDKCIYQIIEKLDPIQNINLYNVKIIKGNKKNPEGIIVHNVPETMLQHIIRKI